VCGGAEATPVALEVTAPDSDKSVWIELSIDDARWVALRMLEITASAAHAERFPF
jgi:hypothetical protein